MTTFAEAGIPALGIVAIMGLLLAAGAARRLGSVWNVPSWLLVMFVIVGPVSGIVHLVRIPGATRGFYDVYGQPQPSIGFALTISVLITFAGLIALWLGTMVGRPARRRSEDASINTSDSPRLWLITGTILAPICYLALVQVQALRENVDATRVWGFDGGNARLVFLASWLPWAITFLVLALATRLRSKGPLLIVGTVGIFLMYIATDWSGGRSLILLFAFPLLLWMFPRIGRYRWVAALLAVVAVAWLVIAGTLERTATFAVQEVNVPGIVDWEWGRFSMTTFAASYVNSDGLLYGETYIAAALQVPIAIINIAGGGIESGLRSISQVTSTELLGSSTLNYTVPGALAEAYMNVGLFGVLLVCFGLGWSANWLDRAFRSAQSTSVRLLLGYLIAILIFRSLVAESVSIFTYVAFTGLPLLVIAAIDQSRTRSELRAGAEIPSERRKVHD